MKTLEQFVKDNEGQFLEVAGSSNAKNMCVDCVNGYIRDVLGLPIIEWTNAIDFKNKANGNYEIIYNDINNPNLVPDIGDIVVYKHPNNIGHIGVCIKKGITTTFGIFEENWPVGSPCKSILNKKYIIGDYVVDYWMKPKKSIIESDMTTDEKNALGLLESYKITAGHGNLEGAINTLIGNVTALRNAQETIFNQKKDIESLEKQIEISDGAIKTLEEQLKIANIVSDGLKTTISDQYKEMDKKNLKYGELLEKYNTLLPKYEELLKNGDSCQTSKPTANNEIDKTQTRDLIVIVLERLVIKIKNLFKK